MRRHRFDPFSLLFGALFVGMGVSFLLGSTIVDARRAVWPVFAILVGGAFVAWAVTAVIRERRPVPPAAVGDEPHAEEPQEKDPPEEREPI
jgi:hypothetical protein